MRDRADDHGAGAPTGTAGCASAGLAAQAALVASGRVTSVELTSAALDRIERTQATLGAFRVVRDVALGEAAAADRRLASGARLALLGVPVAI